MKHLLLEFMETPTDANVDFSFIEYDNELNLSVIKGTKLPAITFLDEATTTFTKTNGEVSDSDNQIEYSQKIDSNIPANEIKMTISDKTISGLKTLMASSTKTFTNAELSDSDPVRRFEVSNLLATRTMTETIEATDSDK